MKNICFSLICLALFVNILKAQNTTMDTTYTRLVTEAFAHLQKSECQPCLEKYETAFQISQRSVLSRLRASLCAFDCNNEQQFLYHLNFAFQKDGSQAEGILEGGYEEFDKYRNTEYFKIAGARCDSVLKKANYNIALRKELANIERDDQELRHKMNEKSLTDEQKQALWQKINVQDSINLKKIEDILDKYGYPGKKMVGDKYSGIAWLVIQHSNLETMKKYYKLINEAMKAGELAKSSYALFEDRYRMWSGEKQIYGSQVKNDKDGKPYFHPIEDEENINKRREEMGMEPLENYAKRFGMEYKVPAKKVN
jgi:hypothetical protein